MILGINIIGKIRCPDYGTSCDSYWLDLSRNETAHWQVLWRIRKKVNWTNFVNYVGADLYIDDVDEYDEASHGDGYNTPSNEAYGDMMKEDHPG